MGHEASKNPTGQRCQQEPGWTTTSVRACLGLDASSSLARPRCQQESSQAMVLAAAKMRPAGDWPGNGASRSTAGSRCQEDHNEAWGRLQVRRP